MEQSFEIISCIEILANNIKIYTTDQYTVQCLTPSNNELDKFSANQLLDINEAKYNYN